MKVGTLKRDFVDRSAIKRRNYRKKRGKQERKEKNGKPGSVNYGIKGGKAIGEGKKEGKEKKLESC